MFTRTIVGLWLGCRSSISWSGLGVKDEILRVFRFWNVGSYGVIETGEVIYITFAGHSKTAGSITHRHTTTYARWIRQYIVYTLPPNTPQAERMTWSMIEMHISSFGAHICTLLDRIDTTLLYHQIPNGITPHTYLFPLRRRHVHSSIGIHAHISCECPSYQ